MPHLVETREKTRKENGENWCCVYGGDEKKTK